MTATPIAPEKPAPRKGSARVAFLLFAVLIGFELLKSIRFHAPKQMDVGALHLRDLRGRPLPPETFAGKAVLLNYWAPWCGPCKLEIPWLAELQRAHPDDLVVLGVVDDPQDYADALLYMQQHGATYPLVQLSAETLAATGPMHTVPTTFYLSRSGKVLHAIDGVVPKPVLMHWGNDAIAAR